MKQKRGLEWRDAAEDLLGHVHHAGHSGRYRSAASVGACGYDSDWDCELVVRVSDGLVWVGLRLSQTRIIMKLRFPLFVFEKDDSSMRLVENERNLFGHLEEIDIQNSEYLFWDVSGVGVCLQINKRKIVAIENCENGKALAEAFAAYCQSLRLAVDLAGSPLEAWNRILDGAKKRPKRTGLRQ
jgi:hypothetical protein